MESCQLFDSRFTGKHFLSDIAKKLNQWKKMTQETANILVLVVGLVYLNFKTDKSFITGEMIGSVLVVTILVVLKCSGNLFANYSSAEIGLGVFLKIYSFFHLKA